MAHQGTVVVAAAAAAAAVAADTSLAPVASAPALEHRHRSLAASTDQAVASSSALAPSLAAAFAAVVVVGRETAFEVEGTSGLVALACRQAPEKQPALELERPACGRWQLLSSQELVESWW